MASQNNGKRNNDYMGNRKNRSLVTDGTSEIKM